LVRLVDLRESALDLAEVDAVLAGNSSGGVTVFVGRVRDRDGGRPVTGLDYSAHPTALGVMQRIVASVASEYAVDGLAAVHRLGTLAIGEAAVIVGACAAHRDRSFAAARALIDRIKAEVPIWKHQHFSDGSEEWVGTP
jgi:molybdopterin synthase catalytic subunit